MIRIQHSGGHVYDMQFVEGETVEGLLLRFKSQFQIRFRSAATLQNAQGGGNTLAPSDLIVDERVYQLNAWLSHAPAF